VCDFDEEKIAKERQRERTNGHTTNEQSLCFRWTTDLCLLPAKLPPIRFSVQVFVQALGVSPLLVSSTWPLFNMKREH